MARKKRVAFARINRRSEEQEAFEMRPLKQDMVTLVESHETHATFRGAEWIAADLQILPGEEFMTGVLGFAAEEVFRHIDIDAFSWLKGPTTTIEGASPRTMVPFAVDLREGHRWVAFGTSQWIQPPGFAAGFERTLNEAIGTLNLMPSEWSVDLVLGKYRVEEWLHEHPNVVRFTRTVRLHNPSVQLDQDRKEMRALAARLKTESFSAGRNKYLQISDNPEFEQKLEGLDTGDLDIHLEARTANTRTTFSSRAMADRTWVEDYGDNLELGMELMLQAVQDYAAEHGGGQGRLV